MGYALLVQGDAVIVLPRQATIRQSYELIEACARAGRTRDAVSFDASSVTRFGPFGVATLAATIAFRRETGRATDLLLPHAPEVRRFVSEVGLDTFASSGGLESGTLKVREFRAQNPLYTAQVAEILVRGVPGISDDDSYPIQLCLNELMQNVFEWSRSNMGAQR
jgi:anti-anti-sigma regulatory factor